MAVTLARTVALTLSLVSPATFAGSSEPEGSRTPGPPPSFEEYPPHDDDLRYPLERGWKVKEARRRLEEEPEDPETVLHLLQVRRASDALRLAREIVVRHPKRIAQVAEIVTGRWQGIDSGGKSIHQAALDDVLDAARSRIPELSREDAARAERTWMYTTVEAESLKERFANRQKQREAFMEKYAGTEAAALEEIDFIGSRYDNTKENIEALEKIVEKNPGTVVAAKALTWKAHELKRRPARRREGDPVQWTINAMLEVAEVVRELESGKYPDCRWVKGAPGLMTDFYTPDLPWDRPDIEKMLGVYKDFLIRHQEIDERYPLGSKSVWVLTGKMLPLFDRLGTSFEGVERVLDELAAGASNRDAVRYLRTLCYLQQLRSPSVLGPDPLHQKVVDSLTVLSREAEEKTARRALATLAAYHFFEGDYRAARSRYEDYVRLHSEGDYAWVASLRAGQCEEALGDLSGALAWYRMTAGNARTPYARILAQGHAAHCLEGLSRFDEALVAYRTVLSSWDADYGLRYDSRIVSRGDVEEHLRDEGKLFRESVRRRVSRLEKSLGFRGGAQMEHGRWLLERERLAEARRTLGWVLARRPGSAIESEARQLLHLVRLETALDLARVEGDRPDPAGAETELGRVLADDYDPGVSLARMALACLRLNEGKEAAADSLTGRALRDWYAWQTRQADAAEPSRLRREVLAIREVLFHPKRKQPSYLIVDPEVQVTLADGSVIPMNLSTPIPGVDSVLFVDSRMLGYFGRIIGALGGREKAAPTSVMAVPNQPIGGSRAILELWRGYFPCRPGHWMGWVFRSYPIITRFEFLNEELTRAAVPVTTGYQGHTAILEKVDGVWQVEKTVGHWVT